MAVHEFGLMDKAPMRGERYDTYEPRRYHCISVDDSYIEGRLWDFQILPTYAHTVDFPWGGLCYCGVTLIPPHAAREMRWMVCTDAALASLTALLDTADRENKWVIHYGL